MRYYLISFLIAGVGVDIQTAQKAETPEEAIEAVRERYPNGYNFEVRS